MPTSSAEATAATAATAAAAAARTSPSPAAGSGDPPQRLGSAQHAAPHQPGCAYSPAAAPSSLAAAAAPSSLAAAAGATARSLWRALTLSEVSGSLGDLGTFLPLLVGLVDTADLDLSTSLIFTGAYNILSGLAFGIPMPVQPMKTIAAVALSQQPLTVPQVMAAGIFVSTCVLALGALRAFRLAGRLIPLPVIRGMQLGLGLQLARKGWLTAWYANSKGPPTRGWWGPQGLLLALFTLAFTLLAVYPREDEEERSTGDAAAAPLLPTRQQEQHDGGRRASSSSSDGGGSPKGADDCAVLDNATCSTASGSRLRHPLLSMTRGLEQLAERAERCLSGGGSAQGAGCSGTGRLQRPAAFQLPAALVLVGLGLALTLVCYPGVVSALRFGPSAIEAAIPSAADWRIGILQAGLPQLALTSFNSVISVCQLGAQLFPDRAPSPDRVALSVGAMNLVGCWFGAMPCCHGSGGLAAQARFGARTGAAPVFLGMVKLGMGLLFGSSLRSLLARFPAPLLGAMLVFAGIQLAACGCSQRGERGAAVLLLTAATTLATANVALGVLAGLCAAYLLLAWDWALELMAPLCRRKAARCRTCCPAAVGRGGGSGGVQLPAACEC